MPGVAGVAQRPHVLQVFAVQQQQHARRPPPPGAGAPQAAEHAVIAWATGWQAAG